MRLTRKRQAYLSILGLCAAALLLEKTVLGPAEVSASEGSESLLIASSAAEPAVPEGMVPGGDPSGVGRIAAQLQAIAEERRLDLARVPDAFAAPASWLPADAAAPPIGRGSSPAGEFRAGHRLTAAMAAGPSSIAIVDGRRLRVGDALDGFTLVEVSGDAAAFSDADGDRVTLVLER